MHFEKELRLARCFGISEFKRCFGISEFKVLQRFYALDFAESQLNFSDSEQLSEPQLEILV